MDSITPPTFVVNIVTKPKAAPYVPAIRPWLRPLLWATFAGFAVLAATGLYMFGVTVMNWLQPETTYQTPFNFLMIIAHGAIGLLGTLPFILFGGLHYFTSRHRENKKAVRLGLLVFGLGILTILTGVALFQFDTLPKLPTGSTSRLVVYWLHILIPVVCVAAYIGHRRAGPRIKWGYGKIWGAVVAVAMIGMVALHNYDPRAAARQQSAMGDKYFEPSLARTADGKFIPAEALMNDKYCIDCHRDIYEDHLHSSHKFSSFNNPAYLFSVKETREFALKRDGNVNASRWCAGCHDPVPFFSGQFDDPNFDFENHATGHAGVTCVVCHSITEVHGPVGNAAYTIEEQQQYPFTYTDNPVLKWVNHQMVKAKPEFHKKTMLKPLHKSAEFCSTCHKVSLPSELNHYKEFLRGQNHYDSFILSGAGHGSRSFYFPAKASENCATCHMPLKGSTDFGAKDYDNTGGTKVHHHGFPGANTGLFELLKHEPKYQHMTEGFDESIALHTEFLKDKKVRIDLFGVKQFNPDGSVNDESLVALRPQLPSLQPGQTYLFETVVRTLNIGHHFSQGTVDSNEIWVDFEAKAGGKVIARSGATTNPDETGAVDEWSHFINVYMLDKNGHRIDRRNPQDIFTPLYNHQIPPGAANVVHYKMTVPPDVSGPIELTVRVRYRKFDQKYLEYIYGAKNQPIPKLPIVDMCSDTVTLPVGTANVAEQTSPITPVWQRWNDYGIACYLEGGPGKKKGNLRQAEVAFKRLQQLPAADAQWHSHTNLARVYLDLGKLADAAEEVNKSGACDPPAPWWLRAWLGGSVSLETATTPAEWDAAIAQFEKIVDPANQPRERNMNFTRDYVVLAQLGKALYRRSQLEAYGSASQKAILLRSIKAYEQALEVDPEDLASHYGLNQAYTVLGMDAPVGDASTPGTVESVQDLTRMTTTGTSEVAANAVKLAEALTACGQLPTNPEKPRLKTFQQTRSALRLALETATDEPTRVALCMALATVHRELHGIFKEDELAMSRATQLQRAKNPAANAAAEAIVIYPTQRPGAPGLTP
jgi:tetratricopeptide (TPR) repeat protein